MSEHHFHFSADWPGGRSSVGTIRCGHLATEVSIATGMGGPGVGTNPDEMLLGAAATCYLMTLAAMIERAKLPVAAMSFESDITVSVDQGAYQCKRIVHRPRITLAAGASDADMAQLKRLVELADRYCMVSKALRGNVELRVAPRLDRSA
ncbi:MAG: SACOL1771 family peroxiredoxin [Rhodanobacteraceae bacterium]